ECAAKQRCSIEHAVHRSHARDGLSPVHTLAGDERPQDAFRTGFRIDGEYRSAARGRHAPCRLTAERGRSVQRAADVDQIAFRSPTIEAKLLVAKGKEDFFGASLRIERIDRATAGRIVGVWAMGFAPAGIGRAVQHPIYGDEVRFGVRSVRAAELRTKRVEDLLF